MVGRGAERDVEGVHAEQRHVEGHLAQDRPAERAHQLERLRAHHPAGDHDLHAGPDQQLVRDVQRVGDDRELGVVDVAGEFGADREGAGDLRRGGTPVQAHHHSRRHERGRGGTDALLLGRVLGCLVPQRQVVGHAVGDCATPGTGDHLLLGKLVEVAPDSRLGHVQPLGRVLDADPTTVGEQLEESVPAGVPVHRTSCAMVRSFVHNNARNAVGEAGGLRGGDTLA